MRGSLESPPIRIATSRAKLIPVFFGCLLFVAMGCFILAVGAGSSHVGHGVWGILREALAVRRHLWRPVVALLSIVFFGAGAVLVAMSFLRPASLELSPVGLTLTTLFKTTRFAWTDFARFSVVAVTPRSRMVGYVLAPGSRAPRSKMSMSMAGVDGSIGANSWELGAAELADLLTRAHYRWGPPNSR